MLKKASLVSAYGGLQCCVCNHCSTSTPSLPSVLPGSRARPSVEPKGPSRWRSYADVRGSRGYDFRDNMNWPCRKHAGWSPSPYDIFDLERGAEYTKHKFYELVKLYHPDRHGNGNAAGDGLSYVERLERYRLVVQAHEILSDPVKKRAYDAHGAGWGEGRTATRHTRGYSSSADGKTYGFGPDHDSSIFGNATWEDWERWYRRNDESSKQAYSGVYAHQNAFASLVILLAVISGVAQATRAGQYSGAAEEKARVFTEETNKFLASRAEHFARHGATADGRIKHFLEKRDPSLSGLKDEEEETYRKHFANEQMIMPKARPQHTDTG